MQSGIDSSLAREVSLIDYSLAHLDGHFSDPNAVKILQTHALHYATSVFEGIRVYNGNIFLLEQHINRLFNSAKIIGLSPSLSTNECADVLIDLVTRSGLSNAYLRPIFFLGGDDLGVFAPNNITRFGALIWEWPSIFGESSNKVGISLSTQVPYRRPPDICMPSEAKSSAGYLVGNINRRQAVANGYDDALMLTYEGHIAEASGANVFMVKNGRLLTPPPKGILNGITRQVVLSNLPKGLFCKETNISYADFLTADEIFLTGTAYEVMPVRNVDNVKFKPGAVTEAISKIYTTLTQKQLDDGDQNGIN